MDIKNLKKMVDEGADIEDISTRLKKQDSESLGKSLEFLIQYYTSEKSPIILKIFHNMKKNPRFIKIFEEKCNNNDYRLYLFSSIMIFVENELVDLHFHKCMNSNNAVLIYLYIIRCRQIGYFSGNNDILLLLKHINPEIRNKAMDLIYSSQLEGADRSDINNYYSYLSDQVNELWDVDERT